MRATALTVGLLMLTSALVGCQRGQPTWSTVRVRDAATLEPVPQPMIAIQPQSGWQRGSHAAIRGDEDGSARLMIDGWLSHYRVLVKADDHVEHADLPQMVDHYDDQAWHTTSPDGLYEVQLAREWHEPDPFAELESDE